MPTVLIIDDEDLDRKVLHSILLSAGYEVIGTARSGEEGIELSRTLKPDLVTIDLMMPKMNGYEVCQCVKEVDSQTYIMLLTAKGPAVDKEQCFAVGANEYVTKPCDPEYVHERAAEVWWIRLFA